MHTSRNILTMTVKICLSILKRVRAIQPSIFQVMKGFLQGITGILIYIDDILLTGNTNKEHFKNLETVFSCQEQDSLCLKHSQVCFDAPVH